MGLSGTLLSLGAAMAFAGFDLTRKRVSEYLHPFALTWWLQIAGLPIYLAWCLLSGFRWEPRWLEPGLLAIILQSLANGLFLTALRIAPLSRTIPFLSLTPVLTAAAGAMLIDETPSTTGLLGMALVTLGAFFLALARQGQGFKMERGSLLTIVVAMLWSLGSAIDKRALQHANPAAHATLISLGVIAVFSVERLIRTGLKGLHLPRPARPGLLVAAAFGSLALALQLSAFAYALVSVVETTKRAVGGASALLMGRWVLGEAISWRAALATLVIIFGTTLVLWPEPSPSVP